VLPGRELAQPACVLGRLQCRAVASLELCISERGSRCGAALAQTGHSVCGAGVVWGVRLLSLLAQKDRTPWCPAVPLAWCLLVGPPCAHRPAPTS